MATKNGKNSRDRRDSTARPSTRRPSSDRSSVRRPASDRPSARRASSDRYTEYEATSRRAGSSARRTSSGNSSARRPMPERSTTRRSSYDRYEEERGLSKRSAGRRPSGKKMSAKKKAAKRRKRIMLFAAEIILLIVMLGFLYTVLKTERVDRIKIDEGSIVMEMNENVENNEVMQGYRNIALFGVDSREGSLGKGTRSDTIIIASINQDTGDVKLVSVFRDTYLNLGNDNYNKCNAAYAKGGPEQAIMMLNKNLDMNITDYVTVGFDGLIEVIDALGGVDINVTESEIHYLNDYQISMVGTTKDGINFTATEGTDYTPVTHSGMQTLNGLQATAYCRIRYIGNDFQRAQRQRDVIMAIAEKAKGASASELNDIANGVVDNISTSLDISEILGVLKDVGKYSVVANDGFPFEQYRATGRVGSKGSCVIPQDLAKNVEELHKFLFDVDNYEVSSEVKEFSDKVANDTGKYANTAADEFAKKDTNEPADVSGADDADTAGVPADGDDTGGTEINGLEMEEAGELEDIVINEVAATQ